MAGSSPQVLLIGWDAADWGVIDPLLGQGRLPNLSSLLGRGLRRILAAPPPLLSPILWTSIATGRHPHEHGVLGHAMPWRNGRGVSRACALHRTSPALWDISGDSDCRSHVIAWPVTHPTESSAGGVMISDAFTAASVYGLADGHGTDSVYPRHLHPVFQALVRPQSANVDRELARMLGPTPQRDGRDPRIRTCGGVIVEAETICAIAEHVMLHERPWSLAAVCFPGIERLSRLFMEYHPPRRACVSESDFNAWRHVVAGAYELHDRLLGRLARAAGKETTILLVSDHGFRHDDTRPTESPAATKPSHERMAALWHRPEGVFVLAAPERSGQASIPANPKVYDVAPLVLRSLGISMTSDTSSPARARLRAAHDWRDPTERASDEAVAHLLSLGYVEPPDAEVERQVQACRYANTLNLARSLMEDGLLDRCIALLEKQVNEFPGDAAITRLLAEAYRRAGRTEAAQRLLSTLPAPAAGGGKTR